MIRLTFPIPISANAYWGTRMVRNKATGKQMPMLYVTKEAVEYKREVADYARAVGVMAPLAGRVWVDIQLYPNRPQDWARRTRLNPANWDDTLRRPDLDNCRKVLYDAMKDVVFGDDLMVFKDSGEVREPDENGGRVVVTVRQIVRKTNQAVLPGVSTAAPAALGCKSLCLVRLFQES